LFRVIQMNLTHSTVNEQSDISTARALGRLNSVPCCFDQSIAFDVGWLHTVHDGSGKYYELAKLVESPLKHLAAASEVNTNILRNCTCENGKIIYPTLNIRNKAKDARYKTTLEPKIVLFRAGATHRRKHTGSEFTLRQEPILKDTLK
jgi:hypothetical protein